MVHVAARAATKSVTAQRYRPPFIVQSHPLPNGQLYGQEVPVSPLFAVSGSFRVAARNHEEVLLQQVTAAMLTNGTRRHDALELADMLERRAAALSVASEEGRVAFSVKACVADLPIVTELLSECLLEPRFESHDLEIEKQRLVAELQCQALFPRAQAADALTRLLYPRGDIRCRDQFAARIEMIERIGIDDVRGCYRDHFGANDLRIVSVGGVAPAAVADILGAQLGTWQAKTVHTDTGRAAADFPAPASVRVRTPGERYAVAIGHRLELRCGHPDYVPMWLADRMFGGSFTSRLVRSIRDDLGLSYSVGSRLTRPAFRVDGHWSVEVSLSPDRLQPGLDAVHREIERFVADGVGGDEVHAHKREAIGAFRVGMASLSGMGKIILAGAEQGYGADYIDEFSARLDSVTVDDVNRVIRRYLRPEALCEVLAGPSD